MTASVETQSNFILLLINYFNVLYFAFGVAVAIFFDLSGFQLIWLLCVWIYLVPALVCRLFITFCGRPVGTVEQNTRTFRNWWFLTQLQIMYSRLPFIEELLRFVPGLYSVWLNIWGARVSLFAYWSPGVTVADRYHLRIGARTVIGGGCRIGGHVVTIDQDKSQVLIVAPLRIDSGAMIGLQAAVGPGCHVHAGETVAAGKLLKPFHVMREGRLHRPTSDDIKQTAN